MIAAVNGVAAGAGASLAFACDLRIVADTAGFNLAFANVALSCDTGASYHLPLLVGRAKAMELLYFPRTVKAAEALELGLATPVVPADDARRRGRRAGRAAGRRAHGRARARSAARSRYAAGHTFAEALEVESAMMSEYRRDQRPPGRGRGVPGQGEAGLRGPLTALSRLGVSQGSRPTTPRAARKTESTWSGATSRIRRRPGLAPYSTVSAAPAKRVVEPAGHGAVADARRSRGSGSAGASLRATRRAKPGILVSVSTPLSGWWKLRIRLRLDLCRRNAHHRPGLGLGGRSRAGLVAAVEVGPAVGEVAVEVDAVGVLAGAGGQPVGVVRRQHPQVDADHLAARRRGPAGSGAGRPRCRAWSRSARPSARPVVPARPRWKATRARPWTEWPMTLRVSTAAGPMRRGRRPRAGPPAPGRPRTAARGPAARRAPRGAPRERAARRCGGIERTCQTAFTR